MENNGRDDSTDVENGQNHSHGDDSNQQESFQCCGTLEFTAMKVKINLPDSKTKCALGLLIVLVVLVIVILKIIYGVDDDLNPIDLTNSFTVQVGSGSDGVI